MRNASPAQPNAAAALEAMLDLDKKRPKRKLNAKAALASAIADVLVMMQTKAWQRASARHFVALFAWLHGEVYGVHPEELHDPKAYMASVACAKRMLGIDFGDEADRMVGFVRWVWARERTIEKKRRDAGNDARGRRITWQLQFAARNLLIDYRVELMRKGIRLS
jgi:hypothetical protein